MHLLMYTDYSARCTIQMTQTYSTVSCTILTCCPSGQKTYNTSGIKVSGIKVACWLKDGPSKLFRLQTSWDLVTYHGKAQGLRDGMYPRSSCDFLIMSFFLRRINDFKKAEKTECSFSSKDIDKSENWAFSEHFIQNKTLNFLLQIFWLQPPNSIVK